MATSINTGFSINSNCAVDTRFIKTFDQMIEVDENSMPDTYFCVNPDDALMYVYQKSNESDPNTGKFRKSTHSPRMIFTDHEPVSSDIKTTYFPGDCVIYGTGFADSYYTEWNTELDRPMFSAENIFIYHVCENGFAKAMSAGDASCLASYKTSNRIINEEFPLPEEFGERALWDCENKLIGCIDENLDTSYETLDQILKKIKTYPSGSRSADLREWKLAFVCYE